MFRNIVDGHLRVGGGEIKGSRVVTCKEKLPCAFAGME